MLDPPTSSSPCEPLQTLIPMLFLCTDYESRLADRNLLRTGRVR